MRLFGQELAEALGKVETPAERSALARIRQGYERLAPVYRREIALVRQGRAGEAEQILLGEGKRLKDALVADLETFFRAVERDLYADAAGANDRADRASAILWALLAAAGLVGAVALVMALKMGSALRRALGELGHLAAVDHLTGLANHRALHAFLDTEIGRSRRYDRPLTLALVDLDRFKEINDRHGHPAGDRVLQELARRLGRYARSTDLVARVGGDKFAWLLPETGSEDAFLAVDWLRAEIASEPFADVGFVTVSVGVAGLEDVSVGDEAIELYRKADEALYACKAAGRNCTLTRARAREAGGGHPGVAAEHGSPHSGRSLTTIRALARALDARDPSTLRHSERVADLAGKLAAGLGWPARREALLREAGLVHDVGKIGLSDALLLKPGALDAAEYELVRRHAAIGAEIVAGALSTEQAAWIRGHHERHDGQGYPDRLGGAGIPDGARILALADAFDVMTSERAYGHVLSTKDAVEEFRMCSGTQFHPEVVDALIRLDAEHALAGEHWFRARARAADRAAEGALHLGGA